MTRAVVAFGSNIAPEVNIPAALERLGRRHRIIARSPTVTTPPIGPISQQPDFHNGAVLVETDRAREAFVLELKSIEVALGREPGGDRWGPRTMDLDVVVWDGRVVDDDVHERSWLTAAVAGLVGELPAPAP